MDKTLKYVKMCSKAKEIQKLRKDKLIYGDYYDLVILEGDAIFIVDRKCIKNNCLPWCQYSIWLPRQDQLQKMIWREDAQHTLLGFTNCVGALFDERDKHWLQFISFEQLWLAFVIHEKYGKHWDNKKEEWVKEKN